MKLFASPKSSSITLDIPKVSKLKSSVSEYEENNMNRDAPQISLSVKDEEINAFRNRLQIRVRARNMATIPAPIGSFREIDVEIGNKDSKHFLSSLLRNIEESDWKEPTAIQMQAIPCLIKGRDVLAAAPTGSGKTAAFLIPILSILFKERNRPEKHRIKGLKALILVPTRELAEQIEREAKRLAHGIFRSLEKDKSSSKANKKAMKICVLTKKIMSKVLQNRVISLLPYTYTY
jgi:ATP-dependent RNA helicase DDX52/ROK1